ncbi:MAG: TlpA disulfide reductase family protein [Bacteroidota bacterium]
MMNTDNYIKILFNHKKSASLTFYLPFIKCRISNVRAKTVLISFILSLNTLCLSQSVTIKGKVDKSYLSEMGENRNNYIYAMTYDDYISYTEKEIDSSSIDANGNFNLSFFISSTTYLFLMVENAKAELYVEPGKTYEVDVLKKDSDAVQTLSIPVTVEIEFKNLDSTDLNFLIADFDSRYEAFLEYHRNFFLSKSNLIFGKIDTMKMLSKQKYSPYNKPYLNNYIEYTFASLEGNITLQDRKKIFVNYIEGKSFQLNNYEYMDFFNQFFSQTVNYFVTTKKMMEDVNVKETFSTLLYDIKQNKLEDDTIQESVVLKALSKAMYIPDYKQNHIQTILNLASKECKSEMNRRTASNLLKKITCMKVGTKSPEFLLPDEKGKMISLYDFKGKYVYVMFWASWCISCIQEMMLIPELKKLYGGKIAFVSISLDKKFDLMKKFLDKNPKINPDKNEKDWTFLYCTNYPKIKKDYNVLTVPTYYLIDMKGNIFKAPADNPASIEPLFYQIKKKK